MTALDRSVFTHLYTLDKTSLRETVKFLASVPM